MTTSRPSSTRRGCRAPANYERCFSRPMPPDRATAVAMGNTREQALVMRLGYRQRDSEDTMNSPVGEDMPQPAELPLQLITETHQIELSAPPHGARLRL